MKIWKTTFSFFFLFVFSQLSFSGIFGGGGSGPLPVVEVGENVAVNKLAKIEQAKATLESIQQTKNQFISLANEAKHLEVWGAKILAETTGLTQADINNLMAIKRMSGELYQDVRSFQNEWDKNFKLDFSSMTPEEILRNYENNLQKYNNIVKRTAEERGRAKETLDGINNKMSEFSKKNAAVVGTNQALQLGNEITNAMNANIQQLTFTLKQQEAERSFKESILLEKERIDHDIRTELYREKAKVTKLPPTKSFEI